MQHEQCIEDQVDRQGATQSPELPGRFEINADGVRADLWAQAEAQGQVCYLRGLIDPTVYFLVARQQPIPQSGGGVRAGRGWDSVPLQLSPDLIDAIPDVKALGVYVRVALRQQRRQQVTVAHLAIEIAMERDYRTGEGIRVDYGEMWQIVHDLKMRHLLREEPGQLDRLKALERQDVEFEAREPERRLKAVEPASRPKPVRPPSTSPKRHVPDVDGQWRGTWPLASLAHYPPRGQAVVYVLRAANDLVVYVGSTDHFLARMKAHAAAGKKWASWSAQPCKSRDEAYEVESEFLREYMPHLNVAGPRRPGVAR